jgi:O-antigen/teichoic acid export membrane protein
MSLREQAVKNVGATWLGLLIHGTVGFFLSPFILHRLGSEAYSLWILIFAFTGYFGLLDLGIRSSIVKYTAKFIANNEEDELSKYLSTSLAFYLAMGMAVLLLTAIGSVYFRFLFKIPAGSIDQARLLFAIAGIGVAVTFPLGVFAGALEGLQKFSWLQLSQISVTLLRALLIITILSSGGGLLAIGIITVATNLLSYVAFTWMAIRLLPVSLNVRRVERAALFKMAGYGVFAFAIVAAEKLRFQSDAIVIGAMLSSSAITIFAIGSKLVEYSSYAVRSMSQIFTPMSSQFEAAGDIDRLRRTFVAGNRACAFVVFPVCVALVLLGRPLIEAWVGDQYIASYYVLVLLIIPRSLYLAQSVSTKILLGMGRHRMLAAILLFEGCANLLLSLLFVQRWGLLGVALGTAVPLTCTSVAFLPGHLCRILGISVREFLTRAYALPLALCVPLGATLWFLGQQFPPHTYIGLALQIAAGGTIYSLGLMLALWSGGARSIKPSHLVAQLLEPK